MTRTAGLLSRRPEREYSGERKRPQKVRLPRSRMTIMESPMFQPTYHIQRYDSYIIPCFLRKVNSLRKKFKKVLTNHRIRDIIESPMKKE